ncbi:MAG: hypothetical protein Q9204_003355 [Flavoplaca sp. TL-2023a]
MASREGRFVGDTRKFSSQPCRKSWFKEPAKESWWSDSPKKPSAAARFAEKLVLGCIIVGSVGYCLTLPAVKDHLNAKLKDLDVFGVEKLRSELEEHMSQSKKPQQSISVSGSSPTVTDPMSTAAKQHEEAVNTKGQTSQAPHHMSDAAYEQQKAEEERIEKEKFSESRIPNPFSRDEDECLAATWLNPACKPYWSLWWETASKEERHAHWMVGLKLKYKFGFIWNDPDENPWK